MAVEGCARQMVQAEDGAQSCVAELKSVMEPMAMESKAAWLELCSRRVLWLDALQVPPTITVHYGALRTVAA